jgi:Kef-type K+ transport system membrane component KefB
MKEITMTPLKGLPPGMLMYLLLQLVVLLGTAHLLGELARRWKQPAVLGNILAGVLLGPSVLGHWFPALQLAIFPHDQNQGNLLSAVTWIGLLLLLVSTGLETDLDLIVRRWRISIFASAGGIVVPLVSGYFLGKFIPGSFLAHPGDRLAFSLFIAVAMCISSLPVLASIMREMKTIPPNTRHIALAAAMMDDTVGWTLLAIVSGLFLSGRFDKWIVVHMVGIAVLFLLASYIVGRPLVRRIVSWTDSVSPHHSAQLAVLVLLGLAGGSITHSMGMEATLGAFIVGVLVGTVPSIRKETSNSLDLIVTSFLGPIYFGLAGTRFDLWGLLHWDTFLVALAVIGIACFGKIVGVYFGAWSGGVSHWERLALSFGMNARGAVEIIVATLGYSMGLLSLQMYSIIVLMAVATAVMAGPMMKWAVSHLDTVGSEVEQLPASGLAHDALSASRN